MGGVQRATGLIRYLSELGWQISVLTVEPFEYPGTDESLLNRIPKGVQVYRTQPSEFRLLRRLLPSRRGNSCANATRNSQLSAWAMIPDSKVFAARRMVSRLASIVSDFRPSVVVTSSPPPSIHTVGAAAKKRHGIKWVADFRDVWFSPSIVPYKTPVHKSIHNRLENSIVTFADRIVVVSEGHEQMLNNKYETVNKRLSLIPNGYDERDFESEPDGIDEDGAYRIGYCGTLNHLTHVPGLFEALVDVARQRILRIDICGALTDDTRRHLEKIDPSGEIIKLHGYLNHADAVKLIRSCNANLVTLASNMHLESTIPGKSYEALRAGRPVIAVVPRGSSCWELLAGFENVLLVDSSDVESSQKDIEQFISHGDTPVKRSGIELYSWENIASTYDELLTGALE